MAIDNTSDVREIDRRVAEACGSSEPSAALHALVEELARSGTSQANLYCALEVPFIATDGNDPLYDILADVMDRIWGGGWAGTAELFPHPPTAADLEAARDRRVST